MLNNVIRVSFAAVGAITGFTLAKTFFVLENIELALRYKMVVFFISSMLVAFVFFTTGSKIIEMVLELLDKMELTLQRMTLYELSISSGGLIAGLIVANLVTIPINKVDVIGVPISIIANILFACIGIGVALGKKNESLRELFREGKSNEAASFQPKLLDTSVIIDGRIVDIMKAGFLEGRLIVPSFVLEELRHIADSSDSLKRSKGRRGLDVLNILQKDLNVPVSIENIVVENEEEVDNMLLKAAKGLNAKILTIDYNLNKVASFQGVSVLNINELANAVKPIALPGEEMIVQVIKDGKEYGQGIGYMDDGTMIVVEGGRRHIGEEISITVTSVLQTAAGRMIFAKPKYSIERAIS